MFVASFLPVEIDNDLHTLNLKGEAHVNCRVHANEGEKLTHMQHGVYLFSSFSSFFACNNFGDEKNREINPVMKDYMEVYFQ